MLDDNPTPRTTGLHGVSLPLLPWMTHEPTLPRAITLPASYKRVLCAKAKRQISCLLAMPDHPVGSKAIAKAMDITPDGASSVLGQLLRKGLASSTADPASANGGRLYRLTGAGCREQAAQRAGA